MKKIFVLLAACMLAATTMMFSGCDEVKDAITAATANQWYKYNGTYTNKASATVNGSSNAFDFDNMFLYYNSSTKKLQIVATSTIQIASNYYITYEKDLSDTAWNAGAVALHSKVTSVSDPTSGKKQLTATSWGDIGESAILTLLGL